MGLFIQLEEDEGVLYTDWGSAGDIRGALLRLRSGPPRWGLEVDRISVLPTVPGITPAGVVGVARRRELYL